PFPLRGGKHILNLGTAGGMTKASTGFTFVNVQRHTRAVAACLKDKGHPFSKLPACRKRYHFYDAILLDVLTRNRYPGSSIFRNMFLKNKPENVFDFLGEESHLGQELRLFTSFPQMPFIRGFLSVALQRLKP
ncbi:MAG: lycopene cyclase, partial [Bacteroidales bacterium]|nr:lycopene cyclase [Bacteroidales bacterium]